MDIVTFPTTSVFHRRLFCGTNQLFHILWLKLKLETITSSNSELLDCILFSEHLFRIERSTAMSLIDEYIKKITELLQNCNDIALLDLIVKLLQKNS